jgi:F-type H+-transporting ATPase subunit alpha
MTELLKQGRYAPMPVEEQVMAIFAGNEGFLDDLPVESVTRFRTELLQFLRSTRPEIGAAILAEAKLSDEIAEELKGAIGSFKGQFSVEG